MAPNTDEAVILHNGLVCYHAPEQLRKLSVLRRCLDVLSNSRYTICLQANS